MPFFRSERDGVKRSDDFKVYVADSPENATLAVALLNSSLFYWFWRAMFDGYHCGRANISSIPFSLTKIDSSNSRALKILVRDLMLDFKANAERKKVRYQSTGLVVYDEFNVKKSKSIIDRIDETLAQHYGLNEEQLDFIINYDIKYRMGLSGNSGEDSGE